MTQDPFQNLPAAAAAFEIPGKFRFAEPCGKGHIHATFRAVFMENGREAQYLFQRLNNNVFHDIPRLMENMVRVTTHIRQKMEGECPHEPLEGEAPTSRMDLRRRVIHLIPARNGAHFHLDEHGDYWRCYHFIDRVRVLECVKTPDDARVIARAWGEFLVALDSFPTRELHETIPDFHHTPKRLDAFEDAVRRDPCKRAAEVADEIAFVRAHRSLAPLVVDALACGGVPLRATHNDTKANNVLIDEKTGRGICVLDLDTCMPGSMLHDFGDMVRSVLGGSEDERDLTQVPFRMDLYAALAEGYIEVAGPLLTPRERELLHLAGPLMTFECGARFLTDYLDGDHYFKTHRPGHNLDRCRVQFHLVREMEARADAMRAVSGA